MAQRPIRQHDDELLEKRGQSFQTGRTPAVLQRPAVQLSDGHEGDGQQAVGQIGAEGRGARVAPQEVGDDVGIDDTARKQARPRGTIGGAWR